MFLFLISLGHNEFEKLFDLLYSIGIIIKGQAEYNLYLF